MLRKRQKLLLLSLGALLALIGAYALFGYQYAPGLVKKQAVSWVREAYGRELAVGAIRIAPFRLQIEVHDVRLPDVDGQEMLGLRRCLVDFQLSSLWRRAWVFRTLELDEPIVRAVVREGGRLNLVDLAYPRNAPPPPPQPQPPPRVWVQNLEVNQGSIDYLVASRAQPLVQRLEPIAFSLSNFRTTLEGGQFHLTASTPAAEHFEWRGHLALSPQVSSTGHIQVAGLQVSSLTGLFFDPPLVAVHSGSIELAGDYSLTIGEQAGLTLQVPQMQVSDLGFGKNGTTEDWIAATRILLEGMEFDLAAQRAQAGRLRLEGLQVKGWLDEQRKVNLVELLPPGSAPEESRAAPGAASGSPAGEAQAGVLPPGWTAGVGAVEIVAAALEFEDRSIPARPRFDVGQLNLSTGPVSLDLASAIEMNMEARINDSASLTLEGKVVPSPLSVALEVALKDARLEIMQPYILPFADLTIRSGTASTTGRLTVDMKAPGAAAVIGFDGDVTIERLHSVDNTLREDLLNLRRVHARKLRYRSAPASLGIQSIQVQEPYARVVISPEQILNIAAVFDPEGAAEKREAFRAVQQGAEAPERKETRAERRQRERAEEQAKQARASAAAAEATLPDPPETFPVRIGEVQLQNGRMNFSDFNIQPNFSAEILDLTGAVTALSSARSAHATVDLTGNVGEFSPVSINGTIQPFAFDRYTDIGLKFENIALPVFNPYSGEFAGYNIAKGSLTTELHYQIELRKLEAQHHIRIDQLEWGEAAESRGEATLPVKFATVLLRDRHGVINLDVPVSGSLDDPTLRIGPIVWQIIKNIIVKAVTAPFALLGALFSGAEEAQFVDFAPGDAMLDATAAERLAQLAKGLAEKPGVSLDIPLGAIPDLDRPALLERRFQQLLEQAAAATGGSRKAEDQLPAYANLTVSRKRDALTGWYREQKREMPQIPPPDFPEGATRAERRDLTDEAALQTLEQDLRSGVSVEDGDLEQLAQARSAAIQGALLRGGELEASRVFIVREERLEAHEGKVRLKLELK